MPPRKIVQLVALGDVLTGLVIAALGLIGDLQVMTILGAVLLVSGLGVSTYLALQRNKPEPL